MHFCVPCAVWLGVLLMIVLNQDGKCRAAIGIGMSGADTYTIDQDVDNKAPISRNLFGIFFEEVIHGIMY